MEKQNTATITIIAVCILALIVGVTAFWGRNNSKNVNTPDVTATTTPTGSVDSRVLPYGELSDVSLKDILVFADFSLTLTKVESDSRCPANANCVWAGTTTVRGEFVDATGTSTKIIELGKTSTFGSVTVTLTEVAPQSITTQTIADSEYRFTLSVQKKSTATTAGKCYVGGCSSEVCSAEPDVASNCIYRRIYVLQIAPAGDVYGSWVDTDIKSYNVNK
jgi:hypothetical protein